MRIMGLNNVFLQYCRSICVILSVIILLLNPIKSHAQNAAANIASSINCETQGVVDLLTKPYASTCIPDGLLNMAVATIISPMMYLPLMLKLRLGYDKIDSLQGNCDRKNRADNKDPRIAFGICSDAMLQFYNLTSNPARIATGLDYNRFYEIHNKGLGDGGVFFDIPTPGSPSPLIPYKIIRQNDKICVATYTFFGSLIAVGCKYIEEPYPTSIYKQFFETGITTPPALSGNVTNPTIPADVERFFNCAKGVGGCAQNATRHSQTMLPISSVIIECIRSTLLSTLISNTTCGVGNGPIQYGGSLFHTFQQNMQTTVMALLTLYVMFIGFKLILGQGQVPPAGELIMYAVKLILVIYFSVGININGHGRFDGMVEWVFPLLLNMANEMASWISGATPSGLCVFPIEGMDYADRMSRLALWDTLDCKVMHYLGFDTLSSMYLGGASGDNFGNSVPPYIFLLIPALISGQINLTMLALAYPLVVMSVAAYMVTTFAVCLIAITVLAVLAPIYVPMALFRQTEGYFQSWYQLMISFTLQPVVIVAFMTIMFSVFDQGFYTGCEFEGVKVETKIGQDTVTKQMYILKVDKADYHNPDNYKACTSSLGWMLNQPLAKIAKALSKPAANGGRILSKIPSVQGFSDYQDANDMLKGIQQVSGIFFGYVTLIGGINKQMIVSLFACILMLYLMRELSGQLSEFAADIASGASLSGTTISPRSVTGDNIREKLENYQDNKKSQDLSKREGNLKDDSAGDKKVDSTAPKASGSNSTAPKQSEGEV